MNSLLENYLKLERPQFEDRFSFQRAVWLETRRLSNEAATGKAQEKAQETARDMDHWSYPPEIAPSESDRDVPKDSAIRNFGMKLDGGYIHFKEWNKRPAFRAASYNLMRSGSEESVVERRVEFRTGDLLLCNRARSSDGIFTTLVEGLQSFSHVAVFVMIEDQGETYPAAVEIQHEGVRAVPLKVFLDATFHTYLEVYRSKTLTAEVRSQMSRVALEMMNEAHGFDIDMDESQKINFSCALTVSELYARSGGEKFNGRSRYHEGTCENLKILGNVSSYGRDLLMPDDFTRDKSLTIVGVINNDRFPALVARGLMRESMQRIWQTKTLQSSRFPIAYWIAKAMVLLVQKKIRPMDRWVAKKFGFTLETFPSGPATFISLTPFAESRVERAADQIEAHLLELDLSKYESWRNFGTELKLKGLISDAMSKFGKMYRERPTYSA